MRYLSQIWKDFLDLVFPIQCIGCSKEKTWVCDACFDKINFRLRQSCPECKKENGTGSFCSSCQQNSALCGVLVAGNYHDNLLSESIKKFKYSFARELSDQLGAFMGAFLHDHILKTKMADALDQPLNQARFWLKPEKIMISPIPLHHRRFAWRGFNQSELLTKVLSAKFQFPILSGLVRSRYTSPQTGFQRRERQKNIRGAFHYHGENIKGKNILLIDDVITTGSTLNECARILKKAGAKKIWALVIARN